MEKIIIFLPIIIFFGFFALLIILFLGFVGKLIFKAKADSWTGEIIDKGHNQKRDEGKTEHFYFFKVKLDNGQVHNIATSIKFFNECKVGDRLEKKKGELFPKKIL